MEQKPSVGRIVHYVDEAGHHQAAIVTEVLDVPGLDATAQRYVSLTVFVPRAVLPTTAPAVPFDAAAGAGTWHWPEYVA